MKIGIVIVNYNKENLLKNCLFSLEKVKYDDFSIVVVDNGSKDGSVDVVEELFPHVKLIKLNKNYGFAMPNNRGIGWVIKNGCEAVLLLNNDTEVDSLILQEMVKYIDLKKMTGMVSAKVLFFDDRKKIDAIGHVITPDGLAKHEGFLMNADSLNHPCEVFSPYGAAALYHRDLLEDIKQDNQFLDEDFRLYIEDLDLGWRARLRGWKCVYAPKAVVYHHKSATAGAYSETVAFYTNRNIIYNLIKNYPGWHMPKALLLTFCRYILLLFGSIFGKGAGYKIKSNMGTLKMIMTTLKGIVDAAKNIPKMIRKRKYIQKRKKVSRQEIKRWFDELGLGFLKSIYR